MCIGGRHSDDGCVCDNWGSFCEICYVEFHSAVIVLSDHKVFKSYVSRFLSQDSIFQIFIDSKVMESRLNGRVLFPRVVWITVISDGIAGVESGVQFEDPESESDVGVGSVAIDHSKGISNGANIHGS